MMLLTLGRGMRPCKADAAWSPSALNNLIGWYDASDAATITASSGLVSALADKSPAGNHLSSSGTARPSSGSVTQNARNMISFTDNTNAKYLSRDATTASAAPSGLSSVASTIVLVFKQDAAQSAGAAVSLKSTSFADALVPDLSNSARAYLPDDTGSGYIQLNPTPMPRGSAYCLSFVWSASAIQAYVNGTLAGSDSHASSNYINRFVLGYRCSTSSAWKGAIGELCVYSRALSNTERAVLENYLKGKWGII